MNIGMPEVILLDLTMISEGSGRKAISEHAEVIASLI